MLAAVAVGILESEWATCQENFHRVEPQAMYVLLVRFCCKLHMALIFLLFCMCVLCLSSFHCFQPFVQFIHSLYTFYFFTFNSCIVQMAYGVMAIYFGRVYMQKSMFYSRSRRTWKASATECTREIVCVSQRNCECVPFCSAKIDVHEARKTGPESSNWLKRYSTTNGWK